MQKLVNLVDLVKSFPTYSNEHLVVLAKICVDTAENEPPKITDSAAGNNTELVVNRPLKADHVSRMNAVAASNVYRECVTTKSI